MAISTPAAAHKTQPNATDAALLDVRQVAAKFCCSTRHVYRLSDAGKMPLPVKLGTLVRWRRDELTEWIDAGCPSVRPHIQEGRQMRPDQPEKPRSVDDTRPEGRRTPIPVLQIEDIGCLGYSKSMD